MRAYSRAGVLLHVFAYVRLGEVMWCAVLCCNVV